MRILWVKADKLLPVHNGGNIRSFHILRSLASHHDVTYFSYYGGSHDAAYERELQKQLPGALCVNTEARELSGIRRGVDYAANAWRSAPYAVSRFRSARVQKDLHACLQRGVDVAVCDFLDAAINFPEPLPVPTVLFQHNVESEIWRRHALTEANPVKKQLYQMEFQKMLRYEQQMVRRFHHVIAVSDHDRKLMSTWVDPARITVVPTGVDLDEYRPSPSAQVQPLVVFVGAMDWEPNVDGVEFFCKDIWPSVLRAVPNARFRIVGRNPDRRVQALACNSVEVTGRVPSVVEHLHQAAAVVVPLRVGGGTRLKIYEAMAAGKAVVSTRVGAEGLDVNHGQDIVLADTASELVSAIVSLLTDRTLRTGYEKAAAEQAAHFGWPAIGEAFAQTLAGVIRAGGSSPQRASQEAALAVDIR